MQERVMESLPLIMCESDRLQAANVGKDDLVTGERAM